MPDQPGNENSEIQDNAPDSPSDASYGPPDEPMTYEETGDESGRGRMVLLLAVVFIGAAAALLYVVFQQGVRTGGRNAPPVIIADAGPEKIKPENPGGLDVPHQDKLVYDRVSGETTERVERLLPEPEEPVDLSGLRTETANLDEGVAGEDTVDTSQPGTIDEAIAQPAKKPEIKVATAKPVEALPTEATTGGDQIGDGDEIGSLIDSIPDTDTASIGNAVAQVDTAAVKRASGTMPAATSGDWVVQVGSFQGADLAIKGWESLVRKNGDLLGNLRPDVQLADLGDKGVYYRLRVGPFGSREEAGTLCNALKQRRQDCLVRKT